VLDIVTSASQHLLMLHHLTPRWKLWLFALANTICSAQEDPNPGKVSLQIEAADQQPVGMPLIIHARFHNVGETPISWWRGVGSEVPGTRMFHIETKHQEDAEWRVAELTNHGANEGSGRYGILPPGNSLLVPLAVSVRPQSVAGHDPKSPVYVTSISVRVKGSLGGAGATAEKQISIYHDPRLFEERQVQMLGGLFTGGSSSFWYHVATYHADPVVLDACYRLAELDNASVVNAAFDVLSRQPSIPEERGADFARIVRKWAARDELGPHVIKTALATKSEVARKTALELLVEAKRGSNISVFRVVDALRWSPGDKEWLQRVRSELESFRQRGIRDARLAEDVSRVIQELDQRLAKQ
jgi:hypothetical protein